MNWYIKVLKNYAVFEGRARPKEYWMFFLFHILITLVLSVVCGLIDQESEGLGDTVKSIYGIALLLPGFAVGVRRMHDTGRSGWWMLAPLLNLAYLCKAGDAGANKYGPDPKVLA